MATKDNLDARIIAATNEDIEEAVKKVNSERIYIID